MKTITLKLDDSVYDTFKLASDGKRESISNFIEFATIQYLTSSQFADNSDDTYLKKFKEMEDEVNGSDSSKK